MTISRSDDAPPGLLSAFLDVRQNWYPGEIDTLTGYDQAEYEALKDQTAKVSGDDARSMLRQAANTLLNVNSSSAACTEYIGPDWNERLLTFLESTRSNGTSS